MWDLRCGVDKVIQDRQCTYNTLRRVRVTFLAVEKQKYYLFWVCSCNVRYPARNAHAPYCHPWSAPLHNIFPHYLIKARFSGENLLNTKCVFWFSLQTLSETVLILRRIERGMIQKSSVLHGQYALRLSDSNILQFSGHIFEKYQISLKPVQWEPSYSMRTDRHDKANSLLHPIKTCTGDNETK